MHMRYICAYVFLTNFPRFFESATRRIAQDFQMYPGLDSGGVRSDNLYLKAYKVQIET